MATTTADRAKDLSRFLECPVCLDEYEDRPIYQCPEGHIICDNCVWDCDHCPACRLDMPDTPMRNRAMEYVASHSDTLLGYKNGTPTASAYPLPPAKSSPTVASTEEPNVKKRKAVEYKHFASCDGQQCSRNLVQSIHGIRYKCLECVDYDLCQRCVDEGEHSHHIFARITNKEEADRAQKYCPKESKKPVATPTTTSSYNWRNSSTAYSSSSRSSSSSIPRKTSSPKVKSSRSKH